MFSSGVFLLCAAACGFAAAEWNYGPENDMLMNRLLDEMDDAVGARWGAMYGGGPPMYGPPAPMYGGAPPMYGGGVPMYGGGQAMYGFGGNPAQKCPTCMEDMTKVVVTVGKTAEKVCSCKMGSVLRAADIGRPPHEIAPHVDKIRGVRIKLEKLRQHILELMPLTTKEVPKKLNEDPKKLNDEPKKLNAKPKV